MALWARRWFLARCEGLWKSSLGCEGGGGGGPGEVARGGVL